MLHEGTLGVAIIWHMHQPYYGIGGSSSLHMPWVRLHSTKDYYDMASILSEHPEVRATFNFVPSLLEQIRMYTEEGATDHFLELSLTDPRKLTADEKLLVSDLFFMIHPKRVEPFPRYWELYSKWREWKEGRVGDEPFTLDEISDLQLLFNLAWFDPTHFDDPLLRRLIARGRGFSGKDKRALHEKTLEILSGIIPLYRKLSVRGQAELSTTPFYHPIMPLLYNTDIARDAFPDAVLPDKPFQAPEDIEVHLSRAVAYHEDMFGSAPTGMWPSEGSVSEDILPYLMNAGIKWIATDEAILYHSLEVESRKKVVGNNAPPGTIYRPYRFVQRNREIAIFFRDRYISDQISFSYYNMDTRDSLEHIKYYLRSVYDKVSGTGIEFPLITVILDGENPWENYQNDGLDFLHGLYGLLESEPYLTSVTPCDYIEHIRKKKKRLTRLKRLCPGSWIGGNFRIWIGQREKNMAWELLRKTREFLVSLTDSRKLSKELLSRAWEEIYIAEGSDWFWWFGDDYSSAMDADFDMLFRHHLKRVYEIAGEKPPEELDLPISGRGNEAGERGENGSNE